MMKKEVQAKLKGGAPEKPYEAKGRSAQYLAGQKVADQSALGEITKGAAIKAGREKLPNTAHVLRNLEVDPEETAKSYRDALEASKKPCNYQFYYIILFGNYSKCRRLTCLVTLFW